MIPVTKPFLPPQSQYLDYLNGIWERNWLTNNGPLVNELELNLKHLLDIDHLLFTNNGTIAIQIAIKALDLKGEIITTPYSYVATTSSIVWEGCSPVFVDIDAQSLNIDPSKIESVITDKTSAILATHVYGNPCDVVAIEAIAKKFNLSVIYDAAHAFGTLYSEKSLFAYGDIATTSFHATKLFHTVEGGAVFTPRPEILKKLSLLRNFGHTSPYTFDGVGINGKNSEFHAAMGLCNLKYIQPIIEKRKQLSERYNQWLNGIIERPIIREKTIYNYAYYAVMFKNEDICLKVIQNLETNSIFPRRYFYPSLSQLNYVTHQNNTPISDDISKRVLCLPLYYQLSLDEVDMISRLVLRTVKYL